MLTSCLKALFSWLLKLRAPLQLISSCLSQKTLVIRRQVLQGAEDGVVMCFRAIQFVGQVKGICGSVAAKMVDVSDVNQNFSPAGPCNLALEPGLRGVAANVRLDASCRQPPRPRGCWDPCTEDWPPCRSSINAAQPSRILYEEISFLFDSSARASD